jgi:hypothetical protein
MTIRAQVPVIPWVLRSGYEAVAEHLLEVYFGRGDAGEPYTGAYFETFGRRWDDPGCLNVITAEDLLAVSMLSVDVPARASIDLLGSAGKHATELLAEIPPDIDLVDAGDNLIGPDSAASELWAALRKYKGVGRTKTSKIIARKRPRLVPIFDSVVAHELRLDGSVGHWAGMRDALRADGRALHERAIRLQESVGIDSIVAPIRVLDVVTWMHGQDHARSKVWAQEHGLEVPADADI